LLLLLLLLGAWLRLLWLLLGLGPWLLGLRSRLLLDLRLSLQLGLLLRCRRGRLGGLLWLGSWLWGRRCLLLTGRGRCGSMACWPGRSGLLRAVVWRRRDGCRLHGRHGLDGRGGGCALRGTGIAGGDRARHGRVARVWRAVRDPGGQRHGPHAVGHAEEINHLAAGVNAVGGRSKICEENSIQSTRTLGS
jgi:hypothetical protein